MKLRRMKHWRHRRWPFRWAFHQKPLRLSVDFQELEAAGIEWSPRKSLGVSVISAGVLALCCIGGG